MSDQKTKEILQLVVDPEGNIKSYSIVEGTVESDDDERTRQCILQELKNAKVSLGEIRVIPNARNGSKPRSINYTLVIQ